MKRKDSENKYDEYEIRIKQKIYSYLRKQCNRARKYITLSIIHRLSLSLSLISYDFSLVSLERFIFVEFIGNLEEQN